MRRFVTESGSVITAAVGDELIVSLSELATSGYEWHVSEALPNGLDEFDVEQPLEISDAVGGKNLRIFGFRVNLPGKYVVSLKQYRIWEGPGKAIGTFTFEITS